MKSKAFFASALVALVTGPALAADLSPSVPVYKGAPPPPAPIVTWSGCYIGGNVGWARSQARFDGDGSISSASFAGGGQIGCDYQFASNWVVGVQGLIDASDVTRSRESVLFPRDEFHFSARWFATVTGRVGFLITPTLLIYGKAGWGFVDQRLTVTDVPTGALLNSVNKTFSGPDAGVGLEWMVVRNWTVWLEWDHIFGGDKTLVFTPVNSATTVSERVRRDFDKVLLGINWRFGGFGPVSAAY